MSINRSLLAFASLAGCQHHEQAAGPPGLPYACADGTAAQVFFDGGDPNRSRARLDLDGRTLALRPDPAASGLRYVSEDGLVWAVEGDEARLSQASGGEEREIVRCARLRHGQAAAPIGDVEEH